MTILTLNQGFSETATQSQTAIGHQVSEEVCEKIKGREREVNYIRSYKKLAKVKRKRVLTRVAECRLHESTGRIKLPEPYKTAVDILPKKSSENAEDKLLPQSQLVSKFGRKIKQKEIVSL